MKSDPIEALLNGLRQEQKNIEMTDEMAKRAGISHNVGRNILAIAKVCARKVGEPVDMVQVANAIKFAGENKERLK